MPKTKSFRVAVEGDTVDGRKIERSWLVDIAATYNRATYGARVNKEHIVGVTGQEPFKAYGDVLSCSTEEIELDLGGKKVKRLALNAEIEATDDLVQLVADKQKIYTSIEVAPNFANTGKAGLVGLAVTDTPASLGTEVLSFAMKHPGALSIGPKLKNEGNLFSLGMETSFALADGEVATPPADSAAGLMAAATNFFKNFGKTPEPEKKEEKPAETKPDAANDNDPRFAAIGTGIDMLTSAIGKMSTDFTSSIAALRADHDKLKSTIETTPKPGQFHRQPATGTTGGDIDF